MDDRRLIPSPAKLRQFGLSRASLAVVYCEGAKKSGMWLNSHGVAMRGLYYPLRLVPNCCSPRVSVKPF